MINYLTRMFFKTIAREQSAVLMWSYDEKTALRHLFSSYLLNGNNKQTQIKPD